MAGAYCHYCGRRCFVDRVLPDGSWSGHLATCTEGMAHDRRVTGYDHTTAINPLQPDHRPQHPGGHPMTKRVYQHGTRFVESEAILSAQMSVEGDNHALIDLNAILDDMLPSERIKLAQAARHLACWAEDLPLEIPAPDGAGGA